jgi:hypothetical protein
MSFHNKFQPNLPMTIVGRVCGSLVFGRKVLFMHERIFAKKAVLAVFLGAALVSRPVSGQTTSSDYSIIQRGPHSRVWQSTTLTTNRSGIVTTNLHSYTELCTGLCYFQNGQYVDSTGQITITGTGAAATQGPYTVQWAADASTAGGAVQLTSPDGEQFSSRVFGLALRDVSTGSNVLIAEITNSTGALAGNNQIIYPAAFSGLQADIQDTYGLSGFEQNVILREQPPSPNDYGLNPDMTCLEVLTEFFNPPVPAVTTIETNGESDDVNLSFGDMGIGRGAAFLMPGQGKSGRVKVRKHWEQLNDGRVFLIEEVPYQSLTNLLQALPPHSSVSKPNAKIRRTASLKSLLRPGNALPKKSGVIKAAEAKPRRPGLVIDYALLTGSLTNYVFQGDTTYYISGSLDLYGSPVLEGGTVVKFTNTASASLELLDESTNFVFDTFAYRPAVFTSANDNTVGTPISGSSGTPSTGLATYLLVAETSGVNVLVQGARFSYAGTVFDSPNDESLIFRDCQFFGCGTNVSLANAVDLCLENILVSECGAMVEAVGELHVNGENISLDSLETFGILGPFSGGITNSILTAIGSGLTPFTLDHTVVASSGVGIYQTVGAGSYYLADGSPYRDAGTTNIDPALLADLQTKTTFPPVDIGAYAGAWLTTNATLFPQAGRNIGTPDLGYHYDPIDWALSIAVSNATVTVLPGTALAAYGSQYGVWLWTNAVFNCQGTATSPNYFVRYNTVQEQSNTNWASTAWDAIFLTPSLLDNSSANFAFTDWSVLTLDGQLEGMDSPCPFVLQNCQVYNGEIYAAAPALAVSNCLFRRVFDKVNDAYTNASLSFYNSLFYAGELKIFHLNTGIYTFRDNFLDQTAITNLTNPIDVCRNNAYVTTNFGVLLPENNDVILTNSPAFETGPFGIYYYPTNLTNLIHTGSQSAPAAGLYHYTVTTNNAIEGTNIVSIGFHYVAVGTNGLPLDTNGDGIPDYLEDINGNGLVDSGEIDWQLAGDLGLTVSITQPANNSIIP